MSDDKLIKSEAAFEESKATRLRAKHQLEAGRGRYHMELVARREAGEKWTIADIKAMEACAIDSVDYVRDLYLKFIEADSVYRAAKVQWEADKREYWDSKGR